MAANTALEALIAELLGDVGLLHEKIKELPELLDTPTQQTIHELKAATTQLQQHMQLQRDALQCVNGQLDGFRKESKQWLNTQLQMEMELAKIRLREAAKETLENMSNDAGNYVARTLDQHLANPMSVSQQINQALIAAERRVEDIQAVHNGQSFLYGVTGGFLGTMIAAIILLVLDTFFKH